jgi:hypothetical protein
MPVESARDGAASQAPAETQRPRSVRSAKGPAVTDSMEGLWIPGEKLSSTQKSEGADKTAGRPRSIR